MPRGCRPGTPRVTRTGSRSCSASAKRCGMLPGPAAGWTSVRDLKAPVLGLYGGADQGIPPESIEQMRAALKAAGKPSEIVVYPEAPHGFFADYRPSYRPEAAKDGWKRLLDWFQKHGAR